MSGLWLTLAIGLAAGTFSGIVGTGGSIVLLPILVQQFGPQQAVPIMAVAGLFGNIGKATAWWRQVDWRTFAAYSATGVPAAAFGARTLLVLPPNLAETALGAFFLAMIGFRRFMRNRDIQIGILGLAIVGAVVGFFSGIVLSTGPLSIAAFIAAGMTKGALISTEAAASLAVMVSKVATFRQLGALPWPIIAQGLAIGGSMMAGAYVGKAVVNRMSVRAFDAVMDVLLLVSGVSLLWTAYR